MKLTKLDRNDHQEYVHFVKNKIDMNLNEKGSVKNLPIMESYEKTIYKWIILIMSFW